MAKQKQGSGRRQRKHIIFICPNCHSEIGRAHLLPPMIMCGHVFQSGNPCGWQGVNEVKYAQFVKANKNSANKIHSQHPTVIVQDVQPEDLPFMENVEAEETENG